jgi:predicted nucleotidyltransferase component of viral defense system
MNGYLKNFEIQIETLKSVYYELIQSIEEKSTLKHWWVFGGDTALSIFHFNHRKSFDIDIFVHESQVFDFLDSKWYIDESAMFDSHDYRFDGVNKHLKLRTKENIKVDFLLNEAIINKPIRDDILNLGFELYYESVEDIIAKKVKYRKEENLTRDIFDLAVAIEEDEEILHNLLLTKFITNDDLYLLKNSLKNLNETIYKLELEKIEPNGERYQNIAQNAKQLIIQNINKS